METSRRKRTWTPRRGGDSRGVKEGGRPAGRQARGRGQSSRTRNPITARQQRERYPAGPALSLFGFPPPRDCRLPPAERRPFRSRSPVPAPSLSCLRPFCVPGCFGAPAPGGCARTTRRNDHQRHRAPPFNCCRFCLLSGGAVMARPQCCTAP